MIEQRVLDAGLIVLGGLQTADHDVPGLSADISTLLLIGWGGGGQWHHFAASPEYADGHRHPLDRWTRRIVDELAHDLGGRALYPFGGPPWLPFQTWARAAGIGHQSPIGLLIHPRYGLWHSYRAALAFTSPVALPPHDASVSPCESCRDKPCLTTCPVDAYTVAGFAVGSCRTHVLSEAGRICRDGGCLARDACPIAPDWRYTADQVVFHQTAFANALVV